MLFRLETWGRRRCSGPSEDLGEASAQKQARGRRQAATPSLAAMASSSSWLDRTISAFDCNRTLFLISRAFVSIVVVSVKLTSEGLPRTGRKREAQAGHGSVDMTRSAFA